ncbi:hypothetical protein PHMEG_0005896 [Phytophthora megakarya]|uniref:Uncharacterized protein n=1 Tax=Phytophthora megakarya TaxID=4795 RepID=A0A225WRF6_9STRA|nr:hypothetical protein PHMEG_0005896 [Phytophthora megakarya]
MSGVHVWRILLFLTLCHWCRALSIVKRDVEIVTLVTSAATSDSEPIRIVLPMLLDVQPVLLKVDVTRHVPAQIQSFCRDHGIDTVSCTGAIREALDEVVNFQRFCKKRAVESTLPGFVVTKNIIRSSGGSASSSWLQNDPDDVAIDFCSFALARTKATKTNDCIQPLEKALHLSFDWILALTACEQGDSSNPDDMTETQIVADGLATVEEMIAALQSSSAPDEDMPLMTKESVGDSGVSFSDESGVFEEISVGKEPRFGSTKLTVANTQNDSTDIAPPVIESTSTDVDEFRDQADKYIRHTHDESVELAEAETEKDQDAVEAVIIAKMAEEDLIKSLAGNGSCEALYASQISEERKFRKAWEMGVVVVLVLLVIYLAIDLMVRCVQYVVNHLGLSKQFVNLQHNISLLAGRIPRSTCTSKITNSGSEDCKEPMLRQSKVSLEKTLSQSNNGSKIVEAATLKRSMRRRATAPVHHTSPSFTCVAMMLMTSRNDSMLAKAKALPASNLVHDSNEALAIIQKKYERDLVAAQRIQNAWKAARRRIGRGKFDINEIRRQLYQNGKTTARPPRTETGSTGLFRLVVNTLPPTA